MAGIQSLAQEAFPPFRQYAPRKLVDEATLAVEVVNGLMRGRSWRSVHAHAWGLQAQSEFLLQYIMTRTERQFARAAHLSTRDSGVKRSFSDLANDASPAADALRAEFLAALTTEFGDALEARSALDQLLAGTHPLFSTRRREEVAVDREQRLLQTTQIMLSVVATRATAEASLFEAYEHVKEHGEGPEDESATKLIAELTGRQTSFHDITVKEIFDGLNGSLSLDAFVDLCVGKRARLGQLLSTSLPFLGAYLALVERNGAAADVGRQAHLALDAASTARRLLMVHGYLSLVRAEATGIRARRWYAEEKRRAGSRKGASLVPQGQLANGQDVLGATIPDGLMVQLEGRVVNLKIENDPAPPKFSSFFDLVDLSSGTSTRLRAHMFSLRNNGVRNGAFVRVNGFMRVNPDWHGAPGVDIDRVNLTELRKLSWYDDVTVRVRTYASLYPDELNMAFTLLP